MTTRSILAIAVLVTVPALAACGIDVQERADGGASEVDVRTPLGGLSVRTGVDPADTGLPVHPGARLVHDRDGPGSADVDLSALSFGLHVVAAKFEDPAPPDEIVAYYRHELAAYGEVTECRGDIDFRGRRGEREPVCREERGSREVQLVVGRESSHRIVAVEPRGGGSEFALVRIQMSDER